MLSSTVTDLAIRSHPAAILSAAGPLLTCSGTEAARVGSGSHPSSFCRTLRHTASAYWLHPCTPGTGRRGYSWCWVHPRSPGTEQRNSSLFQKSREHRDPVVAIDKRERSEITPESPGEPQSGAVENGVYGLAEVGTSAHPIMPPILLLCPDIYISLLKENVGGC